MPICPAGNDTMLSIVNVYAVPLLWTVRMKEVLFLKKLSTLHLLVLQAVPLITYNITKNTENYTIVVIWEVCIIYLVI